MGIKKNIIIRDSYKDSVFLMQIAGEIEKLDKINSASLMMATPANKEILKQSSLLCEEGSDARDNDLIIAIDSEDQETLDKTIELILKKFESTFESDDNSVSEISTLEEALKKMKDANLSIISVAGQYAAREAEKSLDRGLHVMIFSDNVTIEEEIELKKKAFKNDLLLMGPDCGTAIINSVPLGFANKIPKGSIGLIAASGTGLQEVTVTIAKNNAGITQAFGTGGRDLSKEVGGLTMLKALEYLKEDPETSVIVLISKPPHPEIAKKIIQEAEKTGKDTVVCFMGSAEQAAKGRVYFTPTLEGAGIAAAQRAAVQEISIKDFSADNIGELVEQARTSIPEGAQYIRGLYSGGTLCDETLDILNKNGIYPYTNAGNNPDYLLDDLSKSRGHTLLDLGEDEFTRGRPHPMIDLSLRNKRILQEAEDPEVGIILFDLVLGYGAHHDPATDMIDTLSSIKGKKLIVSSVCGTEEDPQVYSKQVKILEDNGVFVLPTNAQAARFVLEVLK